MRPKLLPMRLNRKTGGLYTLYYVIPSILHKSCVGGHASPTRGGKSQVARNPGGRSLDTAELHVPAPLHAPQRYEPPPGTIHATLLRLNQRLPWFTAGAAGLIFLLVLAVSVLEETQGSACWRSGDDGGCNAYERSMGLLVTVLIYACAFFAACLFGWTARWSQLWLRRTLRRRLQPRQFAAKDWFVRGDLLEQEYGTLQAAYAAMESGAYPGADRRWGALTLRRLALPLAVTAFIFFIAFVDELDSYFADSDDLFFLGLNLVLLLVLTVFVLVQGIRLSLQHRGMLAQAWTLLAAVENGVFAGAAARNRGHGDAPTAPAAAGGPSFRSWSGR
jgi:hypothetical protein